MKVKKLKNFWNKMGSMGCKWSSLNAPGTRHPLSHSILKLDESPFPIIGPLGVIRIGLPVWKWKSWKIFRTKGVQRDANGPVWMPQALNTPCLIQFWSWMNLPFPLLALWGNKNWPPSMKVKKLKIFWNKLGSKGGKWSSLNAPGTENPLSHSILKLPESPFSIISPLG